MTMNAWAPVRCAALGLLTCAALVTCSSDPSSADDTPTLPNHVNVLDNRYVPDSITIKAGETVTFEWKGFNIHTVTFDDPMLPSSGNRSSGEFTVTFPNSGTFTYYCAVYGRFVMSGKVLVTPARIEPGPTD
jgi:plastocyanin